MYPTAAGSGLKKKIIVHVIPPEITQELPTDGTSKKLASNPQILDATLSTKDTCPSSLNEAIQSRKQAAPAQALNIGMLRQIASEVLQRMQPYCHRKGTERF
jgi:hypothetical protein